MNGVQWGHWEANFRIRLADPGRIFESGLHFSEPDGVDMGYPRAVHRMSCPRSVDDISISQISEG